MTEILNKAIGKKMKNMIRQKAVLKRPLCTTAHLSSLIVLIYFLLIPNWFFSGAAEFKFNLYCDQHLGDRKIKTNI